MKRWTVYCHTHIESERRYVGLTVKTMLQRWNQHVYRSKSAKGGRWHFPNAIRKYGKDAFSHSIIGVYDSFEEANEVERRKIEEWDLRNPEKGFNLAKGGEHRPHLIRKNPWDDPEYRARMTEIGRNAMKNSVVLGRISASLKTYYADPKHLAEMSSRTKAQHRRPGYTSKMIESLRENWKDPDFRKRHEKMWLNPDFRERCSVGLKKMQAPRTHCKAGHELVGSNVSVDRAGRRECRICKNARSRLKYGSDSSFRARSAARRLNPPKSAFCRHGHAMTPDNISEGNRCRTCRNVTKRARYAKRYRRT